MEDEVREKVIKILRTIYDPEIPVNIYDLGLIYGIDLKQEEGKLVCRIEMTLTSPACPVAESLLDQVNSIRYIVDEIDELNVNVVFDPPWSPDKISFEGKLELGLL
jgi:metal-sulfur cluster biosynthetic enzyme